MTNQWFNYAELCFLDHIAEVLVVVRVKCTTHPSGAQTYMYQLKKGDDTIVSYRGDTWIKQSLIRKHFTPSKLDFYSLKDQLLKGIVEEGDFQ